MVASNSNYILYLEMKNQYFRLLPHPYTPNSLSSNPARSDFTRSLRLSYNYSTCVSYNVFIFYPICLKFSSHVGSDAKKKKVFFRIVLFFCKKKQVFKKKTFFFFFKYGINISTQVETTLLWDLFSIYDTVSNYFTSLLLI